MIPRGGPKARARRVALVCALAAFPVGLVGIARGIGLVWEARAIEALLSPRPAEREAAIRELARLRSVRSVPEILGSMGTEDKSNLAGRAVRSSPDAPGGPWEALCARTIREIGGPAIPMLRSKLGAEDSAERFWSLFLLLSVFGMARTEPGPALFSFLDDSDEDVRYIAAIAIGVSASKDHRLLQRLVADLRRTDLPDDRRAATAQAIWEAAEPGDEWLRSLLGDEQRQGESRSPEMTEGMRAAVTAFLVTAEDVSENLRSMSLYGLWTINEGWFPEDLELEGDFQAIIRRGLEHEDASRRLTALFWIEEAFAQNDEAMPRDVLEILGKLLEDGNAEVSQMAREHLAVPAAIPVLLDRIDRNPEALRARQVLGSMAGPEIWPVLFEYLARPDGSIRESALDLLVSIGASEGVGIDRVIGSMASRNPRLRRASAQVLARYHASRTVEAHVLFPLLFDEDEEVLSQIAAALSSSRSLPAEVFEGRVLHLLDRSKPVPVRRAACRAAAGLRSGAIRAVPALTAAAEGDAPELAAEAIEALAVISPEESFPVFLRALGHEDRRVREAAVKTLGAPAEAALPAVRKVAELLRRLDTEEGASLRVRR